MVVVVSHVLGAPLAVVVVGARVDDHHVEVYDWKTAGPWVRT